MEFVLNVYSFRGRLISGDHQMKDISKEDLEITQLDILNLELMQDL